MQLTRVTGSDFRLFERFELEPSPRLNFVFGENASGKTTLMEAIYALGRGRGYRGAAEELRRRGAEAWTVHGEAREGESELSLGAGWSGDGLRLRLNREDSRLHEMARRFPVQALQPDSHRLLEDGPAYRRRYLDWGVFHVEHPFFDAWRRYQRALKQRNQALRQGQSRAAVEAWNPELAATGEEVQQHRQRHLAALQDDVEAQVEAFLGEGGWTVELAPGWPQQESLREALDSHLERDQRQGTTTVGPHRAELRVRKEGWSSRRDASRGQQKLLVAALLMCQARLVAKAVGRPPVLLVDDLPAELGSRFQSALLKALSDYPGQVFATAIEPTDAIRQALETARSGIHEGRAEAAIRPAVFHVEHGSVSRAS